MMWKQYLILTIALLSGCGAMQQTRTEATENPRLRVDQALAHYQRTLATGNSCHTATRGWQDPVDCEGLLREVLALHAAYPYNERVAMLAALVAYQAGRAEQSSYLLDQLLWGQRPRPEAAMLRSRIAMEEGNLNVAHTLLQTQLRLNPRHPGLHETLAAVHYLERNASAALDQLVLAEQLGSPNWQVAYHRGLVLEQQSRRDDACRQYLHAVTLRPDFSAAQSRLMGMLDLPPCRAESVRGG